MTQRPPTQESSYLEAFEALERNGASQDPDWARSLRREAITCFRELGFPVARRGNEEWKYTDVGPLAKRPFRPADPSVASFSPPASAVEPLLLGDATWCRVVFVDGVYAPYLSSPGNLPDKVKVLSLSEGLRTQGDLLEHHLGRHAASQANAFVALNTAFLHDGALVHIPDGAHVEAPIQLLFLVTTREPDLHLHPRVLIVTGRGARATVVESYRALGPETYFCNAVTEIVLGEGSAVEYYKLQQQSEQAFHITNTQVTLARDSAFSSVNIDLGGGLVRHNLNLLMEDEGASCSLLGLYLTTGSQHVDNQVVIDHAKPYTTSRELYKGILNGRSRTVFHGSIIVRPGARKVNAQQEDRNLLLSDQAEADTKPAFWIYCDDVMCRHGAACGQIDSNALLYLRSRGLDELEARNLLVHGFVAEIINGIACEPVRTFVDAEVGQKLRVWLEEAALAAAART